MGGAILERKIKNSVIPIKHLTGNLIEAFRDADLEHRGED